MKQKAFTLVEILIVIVVISILAAVTVLGYSAVSGRAADSSRAANVSNILKVMNNASADRGQFDPAVLMSDGGMSGGIFTPDDISTLHSAGIKPEMLKAPNTPDAVMNGFVFNKPRCDLAEDCPRITDAADDVNVPMYIPADPPSGYGSWNDFWDAYYTTYNDYWDDYRDANPLANDASDEEIDAWYEGLDTGFASAYPDFISGAAADNSTRVDVPKKNIYIVDVLTSGPVGAYGYCNFEYTGNLDYPTFHCSGLDENDQWGEYAITGIRITYWNSSKNDWDIKQTGTGTPAPQYEQYS